MKNLLMSCLLFLITSALCAQKITLLQNTHKHAKELNHSLNKTKDTLLISSVTLFMKGVEILGDDFKFVDDRLGREYKIALDILPSGRYTVNVMTTGDWILLTLLVKRSEGFILKSSEPIKDPKNVERMPTLKELVTPRRDIKAYWTYYRLDTRRGVKLVIGNKIDNIIKKNINDIKSLKGNNNQLKVWEVYDIRAFMKYKISTYDYLSSLNGSYNPQPIYNTRY